MESLKFRYLNKNTSKWVYSGDTSLLHSFWEDANVDAVGGSIQKFTGSVAIDNTEIYNHDFLEDKHGNIGEVVWSDIWGAYLRSWVSDRVELMCHFASGSKIVGNRATHGNMQKRVDL